MATKKPKEKQAAPEPVRRGRGRPRTPPDMSTACGRIGERIRQARERVGLSPAEAAARCGMSCRSWYDMERGAYVWWLEHLAKLLEVLQCEIGEIVPEADVKHSLDRHRKRLERAGRRQPKETDK
jgi:ribosome-binding protein aMBF1 (putative translation factor)